MRNLFQFIFKHFQFILFLLLEIISGYWIVVESSFHQSAYINSSNEMVGKLLKNYANVQSYFHLQKVNDSLAAENVYLKEHQLTAFLTTNNTTKIIGDSTHKAAYQFISAHVISNQTTNINNYIILDKGYKNGVEKNMGVICDKGVVGIVKDVSADFSLVISVLHSKSKVGVKVNGSNYVSMTWDGYDPTTASIADIPKHIKLKMKDTVYTSGESWFYPAHLMVGTIKDFELKNGSNFYSVKVKLSTDFSGLEYVDVVKSLLRSQTDSLISHLHDE